MEKEKTDIIAKTQKTPSEPDVSVQSQGTLEKHKPYRQSFRFVSRHKLPIVIVISVIMLFVVIFSLVPVLPIGNDKIVNADSIVRIEKGQTIKLKYSNVSIKIINFSNTPCPKDQKCFGSGATVEYQLTEGDKGYATGTQTKAVGSKYQVETVNTDYKTYAEIKIIKTDEN